MVQRKDLTSTGSSCFLLCINVFPFPCVPGTKAGFGYRLILVSDILAFLLGRASVLGTGLTKYGPDPDQISLHTTPV